MLEFLLALTRQGHVIYHTTPSHPPNPFPHSSIQQIHNINMKDDGSTHYDILHSIHLIYPICHILHFFLNAISLSLSLSRSFPTTSTTSTCKDRVYPPRPQVHNTSRLAKLKPEAHRILIPPAESEMEWFPRCGAQPLKGQKELRAKILKLWIWGLWNGERLVAESNLHDMCVYI